jgi:DNA invertase Pin-like site-specific DNA recombinase
MKVCIYARVSDDKLKDDGERRQDVDRQVDRLMPQARFWLQQHPDWDQEVGIYKDDGKSAFKEDYNGRPDFLRLQGDVRSNKANRIYVESLDRWSRRVVEGLTTLKFAFEHNSTVTSLAEGEVNWTEPQGWFRSLIALGMAEWASRDKSWKVTDAMERRRNDKRKICKACGEIHMGRHPGSCTCLKCLKKKGR